MVYIYSNDEWKKNKFLFYKLIKTSCYKLIYNSAKLSGQGERYYKKKRTNSICPKETILYQQVYSKKAINSGTQGRKKKT